MLSPFGFLEEVKKDPEVYRKEYLYKINIFLSSTRWEIRNIGIKLIGLFRVKTKADYLINILKSKEENGFVRRNSVISLKQLGSWSPKIRGLLMELLRDPYYEVRVAAVNYLGNNLEPEKYESFRKIIHHKLRTSTLEEKLACIKLVSKLGNRDDLEVLTGFFLSGNSLLREELLELIYNYFKRGVLSKEEIKENLDKILVTSNNLFPEFKLKSIIYKISKEITGK